MYPAVHGHGMTPEPFGDDDDEAFDASLGGRTEASINSGSPTRRGKKQYQRNFQEPESGVIQKTKLARKYNIR